MREYQQKRKIKSRIFSKISILVLLAILIFLARATFNVYQKANASAVNLARINNTLNETKLRHDVLSKETERLKTQEGIEEEIRHKFQVAKEGEKVIVVVDDKKTAGATTTNQSFFDKLKYAILSVIKK